MDLDQFATRVEAVCNRSPDAFDRRVRSEANWLLSAIDEGTFDNDVTTVGLEYEVYGVDDSGALATIPDRVTRALGCEKEIGRHQLEFQVNPQPLCGTGLEAVESEVRARFETVNDELLESGNRVVSDGFWTIPPRGQSTLEYLTATDDRVSVPISTNMVDEVKYHAQSHRAAAELDCPHVSYQGETALLNSLTTSIQPHYGVPTATDLPKFFRYALRIAAPILALAVNSPLFPPDLYDDADPETILSDSRMENRIWVFESVMNSADGPAKVAFPADVESVEDAVESIVSDETVLPLDAEGDGPLAHFSEKHGTFWRWVRPVFDPGATGSANVRVEFRALPSQPTIRDSVALTALLAGLLTDLVERDHPVASQDWAVAEQNFYAAAADGLEADLAWIDRDGERTSETREIYADLFESAHSGLETAGIDANRARKLLEPLQLRVSRRETPARWKLDRVSANLEDDVPFERAVHDAQRAYFRNQVETLERGHFATWSRTERDEARDSDRRGPPERGASDRQAGDSEPGDDLPIDASVWKADIL